MSFLDLVARVQVLLHHYLPLACSSSPYSSNLPSIQEYGSKEEKDKVFFSFFFFSCKHSDILFSLCRPKKKQLVTQTLSLFSSLFSHMNVNLGVEVLFHNTFNHLLQKSGTHCPYLVSYALKIYQVLFCFFFPNFFLG